MSGCQHSVEFLDQTLVPQTGIRFAQHGFVCLVVGERGLVGPGGAECIVNVHYLQDARQERDFLALKAVRIAGTVLVLMMIADNGQH